MSATRNDELRAFFQGLESSRPLPSDAPAWMRGLALAHDRELGAEPGKARAALDAVRGEVPARQLLSGAPSIGLPL